MLLLAALAISPGFAADLDLAIRFNDDEPTCMIVKDVLQADPPQLVVFDDEGDRHLVDLTIDKNSDGSFTLTTVLFRLEEDRKGRLIPIKVAAPRITVPPNEEARISQCSRIPYKDGDEIKFYERALHVTATVIE